MPTLDATTSAVLSTVGISGTTIYTFFYGIFGQAIFVGLWLIQLIWPFLLVIGILVLVVKVAGKALHWHR
jgi:uncharacterized membrane protein